MDWRNIHTGTFFDEVCTSCCTTANLAVFVSLDKKDDEPSQFVLCQVTTSFINTVCQYNKLNLNKLNLNLNLDA